MQRVEEPMETIHVYVVREKVKRPYSLLPLFFAFLCLVGLAALTLYSGEHPLYEHETLRVPALLLPLKTFTTSVTVIPTSRKTYPATTAHGTLTVTNGSILSQELPKGMIFVGSVEVVTDTAVFVPAGSAAGYGVATVSAHVVTPGTKGNIQVLDINQVYGTSLYIRNLQQFTGGKESSAKTFVTAQDRLRAILQARQALSLHTLSGMLVSPCRETIAGNVTLIWTCQFVTYSVPSFMKVTGVRIQGKQLLVDVVYVVSHHLLITK